MIRFSHEANSWQFLTRNPEAIYGPDIWTNVSVRDARWLADRNAIINVI